MSSLVLNYAFLRCFVIFAVLPAILPILTVIMNPGIFPNNIIIIYMLLVYVLWYIPFSLWVIKRQSNIVLLSVFGLSIWPIYILYCILANFGGLYYIASILYVYFGAHEYFTALQLNILAFFLSFSIIVYAAFIAPSRKKNG